MQEIHEAKLKKNLTWNHCFQILCCMKEEEIQELLKNLEKTKRPCDVAKKKKNLSEKRKYNKEVSQ